MLLSQPYIPHVALSVSQRPELLARTPYHMDPNKHNQNLPPSWHHIQPRPSAPLPSTSSSTQSPTPAPAHQYPMIQPRPQSQPHHQGHHPPQAQPSSPVTQFHHYQPPNPPPPTAQSQYPITAPFQVPRVPHPWPFAGANREALEEKAGLTGNPQPRGKGKAKQEEEGYPPGSAG